MCQAAPFPPQHPAGRPRGIPARVWGHVVNHTHRAWSRALPTLWAPLLLSLVTLALALHMPRYRDAGGQAFSIVNRTDLQAVRVGEVEIALDPLAAIEEPDVLESWQEYQRFREVQRHLSELTAEQDRFTLLGREGSVEQVTRAPLSPLSLGISFWVQLLTAVFCASAGEIAWRLAQRSPGLLGYRLAGWGVAGAAWGSSLYAARSVAIEPWLLDLSHFVNTLFGGTLFGGGICMLLASEPRALMRSPLFLLLGLPLTGVLWCAQLSPGPAVAAYTAITIYTIAIPLLITWQWLRLDSPVDRAVWRWLVLATIAGIGFFVLAQGLPIALGRAPLAGQASTLAGFALFFLLMSLGATRYRLFSVARHWGRMWTWLGVAAITLGLDVVLASALPLDVRGSASIAILLVAWGYFPLRESLLRKRPPSTLDVVRVVSDLATADNRAEMYVRFRRLLHSHYLPADMIEVGGATDVQLSDDGRTLTVPSPEEGRALQLAFKHAGRSLFELADVREARTLVQVSRMLLEARAAFFRGEEHERRRLHRDLHDHLGTRLGRMAKLAQDASLGLEIRALSSEVRQITAALAGDPVPWSMVVLELESEARAMARAHDLKLILEVSCDPRSGNAPPSRRGDLLACVRETLNNVARHGSPHMPVDMSIQSDAMGLQIQVTNGLRPTSGEDSGAAPSSGGGLGLSNLAHRATRIGGSFTAQQTGSSFVVRFSVPMTYTRNADENSSPLLGSFPTPEAQLG